MRRWSTAPPNSSGQPDTLRINALLFPFAAGIHAGLKLKVHGEYPLPGAFLREMAGVAPFRKMVTSYVIEETRTGRISADIRSLLSAPVTNILNQYLGLGVFRLPGYSPFMNEKPGNLISTDTTNLASIQY